MAPLYGKIRSSNFLVVNWIFYSIAIVSATSRTILRLKVHRRIHLDDAFLIIASLSLTAATILLHIEKKPIYQVEALQLDPMTAEIDPSNILSTLVRFEKLNFTYLSLTWLTIFSVKFAFLNFFGQLVERIPALIVYWKATIATTVIIFAFRLSDVFIACPYMGFESLKCTSPSRIDISLALGILTICLDITSDIMIVAIPIWLIYKVKMKPKRKLGLATFLCLQVLMAAMAIVRVSGIREKGNFDNPWIFLWQQVEACVAVTMVSFTAFKSVFINDGVQSQTSNNKYWYSSAVERVLNRRKRSQIDDLDDRLPSVPGGTLTGMRTFIEAGSTKTTTDGSYDEQTFDDEIPLQSRQNTIYVSNTTSRAVE